MSELFSAALVRELSYPGYVYKQVSNNMLTGSSPEADLIWRDDPYGTGLRSTQQVDLDWADFTQHTFFNSAESKVNVAFERIINQYPFDGSRKEITEFEDSLSGFERYVLKKWPKYIGDINFTGTQHIFAEDKTGYLFPEISRNVLGERSVGIAANTGDFTVEFWIYASASMDSENSVVFQKINAENNHGISVFLSQSQSSDSQVPVVFGVTSGSIFVSSSMDIPKGEYVHVACVYDKEDINAIKMFRNSALVSSSSAADIDPLDFYSKFIYLASGSSQSFDQHTFLPAGKLVAAIDEFRFWKSARDQSVINEFYHNNVFQNEDLAFYYRFNEPTGSYGSKAIVLDHSGNGLHGQIQNYTDAQRGSKLQNQLPMRYERIKNSPVLFPDYNTVLSLNSLLLTSGSRYDANNPNLITKLVPKHYFLEAQAEEGLEDEDGHLHDQYGFDDDAFPGNGSIPTAQVFSSFLFIWASFFDELKVYLDAFVKLHDINHIPLNSIPGQFLQKLGRLYGLELPNSFGSVSIDGYSDGKNLSSNNPYSSYSLREIQELLWRRLLREMPAIQRMKGTTQSVRSLMLSLGVNPDKSFRIREYGGPKSKKLANNKKLVNSHFNVLDFSLGTPYLSSSHLIGYRHEPGLPFGAPEPEIILIDHMGGESSTIKVAIPGSGPILTSFTSASWSWEGHYKMKKNTENHSQSLFRIESSGSSAPPIGDPSTAISVNLTAHSGSTRAGTPHQMVLAFSGSKTSKLVVTGSGINIFDGDPWYVNVNHIAQPISSSFVVKVFKTNGTDFLEKHYFSGSYANDQDTVNVLTKTDGLSRNIIGIGFREPTSYKQELLNFAGHNTTHFDGSVGSVRFWTKALEENECSEHALNPFSVGTNKPLVNYGFFFKDGVPIANVAEQIKTGSYPFGSFERLRLSSDFYQEVSSSDSSGNIQIIDTAQQGAFQGIGFNADVEIFKPVVKMFSRLDPNYDITINANKVRIRSVLDQELAEELNAESGALYEIDPREPITDDRRFSVEASIVQALNEDIVNILADNQYINDAMGTPEMMFSVNYPALERLADKYFYRLTDKINTSEYLKFFKWFDNNFGALIEKLVPRTTEFLGINFVIESHMLERHRFEYKQADVHIDLNSRLAARIDPVLEGIIRNEAT